MATVVSMSAVTRMNSVANRTTEATDLHLNPTGIRSCGTSNHQSENSSSCECEAFHDSIPIMESCDIRLRQFLPVVVTGEWQPVCQKLHETHKALLDKQLHTISPNSAVTQSVITSTFPVTH